MGESHVTKIADASPWLIAHEALSQLARERATADAEEGRWLLAAFRSAAHVHLGFGSFSEYVERLFGYKPRSTQEKLRVAEALEGLPGLSRALSEGRSQWSVVRELTRVAIAETESEWLAIAQGKTLRQVEELVSGKRLGDGPGDPRDPVAERHTLRFEVSAETLASFREARSELRRRSDVTIDDDALLLEMARLVLGGPRDEGRASYQISISICPECGGGSQAGSGEWLRVGSEVVAMACCDGQDVGDVSLEPVVPVPHVATKSNDGAPVRANADRVVAGPVSANAGSPENGSAIDGAPVGAKRARGRTHVRVRAVQSIPPALRRAVLLRDQRRCRVPGCKNSTFVDVHHICLRSEAGDNTMDNLVTLCGAHHRAGHRGQLRIDGNRATAVVFRHADGSEYGQVVQPQAQEAAAKVFAGLRKLGFREGEVRSVFSQLRSEGLIQGSSAEQLLRAALARLRPPRARVV